MQYDPNQPMQPYQQPMQPPRKKRGVGFWLLVIGLPVLLVCALCGTISVIASRSTSAPSTVIGTATAIPTEDGTQQGNTPTSNQPITFKVGQTVSTPDGYIVTVNKVYTSAGDNNFNVPHKGNQYLIVDVSTKNNTGSVQHMASIQFTLSDASGQPLDNTFIDMPNIHDYEGGILQNGATLRGQLVYEVPTGKHNYTFVFQGDMTSTYQTMWDIHS